MDEARIASLRQQGAVLTERVREMLATPEDQRPTGRTALKAWLRDLESTQKMAVQFARLLKVLEVKPELPPRAAAAARRASADTAANECDVVVLARIPKGQRAEMRVTAKTWKGRRVIDVRCWAMGKDSGEYAPTRKGVAVDAKMLPALVEALQQAQKHA